MLDNLPPEHWPAVEIPRVDADVPDAPGLPATYYRAVAARLRQKLDGRLRLTYITRTTPPS